MRKIKITALVLAVLMVMAAFAGCASKSAVEDLDERVTALEGKIDANQKANEEQIDKLAALIEALTKSQSDIKESVESNKNDQAASNQEIKDSIAANQAAQNAADKALQDAIAANQAAQNAADKALQETLNQLLDKLNQLEKEQDDQAAADKADKEAAAELQTYKATAAAKIATLQASYLANKADYAAADYVKIVEILATANIAVEQANDKAAVDAAMKKLDTDLNGYTTVNQGIYNIYLELKGNIVPGAETDAKVKAAQAALAAAREHYGAAEDVKLRKFAVGGFQADGKTPLTIDLIDSLSKLCETFTSTVDIYNTRLEIVEPDGTKTVYATLAYVEALADELVKRINTMALREIKIANADQFLTLEEQYKAWANFAKLLSEKNLALVTNTAKLDEMIATTKNLLAAKKAFGETLNFDNTPGAKHPISIFASFLALEDEDEGETLYSNYEKVYLVIDTALAAWKAEYKLTDKQVKDIIANDHYVPNTYGTADVLSHAAMDEAAYNDYLAKRDLCKWYYDEYIVFSKTIAPRIVALNKALVSINNSGDIKEFRSIAVAIDEWKLVKKLSTAEFAVYDTYADVTIDAKKNLYVSDANFNAMVNDINLKKGYADGFDTTAKTNVDYFGLYTFTKGQYENTATIYGFFTETYRSAKAIADDINDAIADATSAHVFGLVKVDGSYNYTESPRKFWQMTEQELIALETNAKAWYTTTTVTVPGTAETATVVVYKDVATIEASDVIDIATFKVANDGSFDLAGILVDQAAFDSKWASIEKKVAELKPIANSILESIKDLTAANVEANVNLDAHEAKVGAAYNEQFLPNWVKNGATVFYAEAIFDADDETLGSYTVVDLLTAAQCETLHFAAAEIDDLRKQADVLIAAYKTIADMNAVAPITIKSIIDDTRWFEFSYAAKASKGIYYVTATAAKELFAIGVYEDEVSEKETLAKTLFATDLVANGLDYAAMIEAVSAYYATFKADNAGKTAKDVTAAMGDFAKYELMAKKAVILETILGAPADTTTTPATPATGLYALVESKTEDVVNAVTNKFYNTIFEVVSAAKDIKAVETYLKSEDFKAQWAEYGLGTMNIPATTYAGASLLGAISIG